MSIELKIHHQTEEPKKRWKVLGTVTFHYESDTIFAETQHQADEKAFEDMDRLAVKCLTTGECAEDLIERDITHMEIVKDKTYAIPLPVGEEGREAGCWLDGNKLYIAGENNTDAIGRMLEHLEQTQEDIRDE